MPLKREAVGFALAPLPAVALLTLLFGVILLDRPSDSTSVVAAWLQLVAAGYGLTLLVGIPVHLALRRLGRCSLRAYWSAATVVVAAIAIAIELLQLLLRASPEQNPHGIMLASAAGFAAMLVFEGLTLIGTWIFWRVSIKPRSGELSASSFTTGI